MIIPLWFYKDLSISVLERSSTEISLGMQNMRLVASNDTYACISSCYHLFVNMTLKSRIEECLSFAAVFTKE